jgi:hypothetical protein
VGIDLLESISPVRDFSDFLNLRRYEFDVQCTPILFEILNGRRVVYQGFQGEDAEIKVGLTLIFFVPGIGMISSP